MANALDEAVKKAVGDGAGKVVLDIDGKPLKNDDGEQVELKDKRKAKTEEVQEETTEEPQEEPQKDKKTEEAVRLWEALADPNLAPGIIKEMARTAGLVIGPEPTRAETKEAAKGVLDILKENLPPEQQFLADSMGPAIVKMIEATVERQTAVLKQQADDQMLSQAKNEVETTFSRLEKKYPDLRKFEKEMDKLADKYTRAPNADFEEYVEGLYHLASRDKKVSSTLEKTVAKINKNASKTLPASAQVDDTEVRRGSKLPTLKEAVDAARRGERFT